MLGFIGQVSRRSESPREGAGLRLQLGPGRVRAVAWRPRGLGGLGLAGPGAEGPRRLCRGAGELPDRGLAAERGLRRRGRAGAWLGGGHQGSGPRHVLRVPHALGVAARPAATLGATFGRRPPADRPPRGQRPAAWRRWAVGPWALCGCVAHPRPVNSRQGDPGLCPVCLITCDSPARIAQGRVLSPDVTFIHLFRCRD